MEFSTSSPTPEGGFFEHADHLATTPAGALPKLKVSTITAKSRLVALGNPEAGLLVRDKDHLAVFDFYASWHLSGPVSSKDRTLVTNQFRLSKPATDDFCGLAILVARHSKVCALDMMFLGREQDVVDILVKKGRVYELSTGDSDEWAVKQVHKYLSGDQTGTESIRNFKASVKLGTANTRVCSNLSLHLTGAKSTSHIGDMLSALLTKLSGIKAFCYIENHSTQISMVNYLFNLGQRVDLAAADAAYVARGKNTVLSERFHGLSIKILDEAKMIVYATGSGMVSTAHSSVDPADRDKLLQGIQDELENFPASAFVQESTDPFAD